MAATVCPKCGKSLRPGAHFCGNCGAVIPKNGLEDPASLSSADVNSGVETITCPSCGKSLRAGAKYCNYCGLEISASIGMGASQALETPPQKTEERIGKPPQRKQSARSMPIKKTRRWTTLLWFIAGGLLICLAAGLAGYLYYQDPFAWRTTVKSAETQPALIETEKPDATITSMPVEAPPTTEVTATTLPSPSSTPEATSQLAATLPVTASFELTATNPPIEASPAVIVLISDEFNHPVSENWKSWGDPRPTIRKGFGDNWLELKASEHPTKAGITSRVEIPSFPDTRVEFEAQINPSYPQYRLLFDWDPLQYDRGPDNSAPTIIHLEIQKNLVTLFAPASNSTCKINLDGAQNHMYILEFKAENIVELLLDDNGLPDCSINMGANPAYGRITFTGSGWVTRVLATSMIAP